MSVKYLAVSVPSSITPSGHKDDAISALQKAVNPSYGEVPNFNIPEFKVGTLDGLLQQSDELSKLESLCNSVVAKVGDTLKNVLDGDEEKISMHKNVNDSMYARANAAARDGQETDYLNQNLSNNTYGASRGTRSNIEQIDHCQN